MHPTPDVTARGAGRGAFLRRCGTGLAAGAALLAALSLIDPRWLRLGYLPPVLCCIALMLERRPKQRVRVRVIASLALLYWVAALVGPQFGADSPAYYAYARSLLFDGDLDFRNEWQRWGLRPLATGPTGLMMSAWSVGPALLWSPFVLASHAYVLLLGGLGLSGFAADGYSLPYLRATAVGTLTWAGAAAWLLRGVLAPRVGNTLAWISVLGGVATSPVIFYLFVHPGMSHGLAFALSGALLWALDRLDRDPSPLRWVVVGILLGLLLATRWQSVVVVALPVLAGIAALARGKAKPWWLAAGAAAGLVAFAPQMAAWHVLFGEWITVPPGDGAQLRGGADWFSPASPRAWEVLFSADHGLFAWTPFTAAAAIALVASARRWGLLGWGGVILFVATAWLNGSLGDWHGSHAFGARRFDVVVPFLSLGLGSLLRWLVTRPVIPVLVLVALATAWNAGLMTLYTRGVLPAAAPLEKVAQGQARLLRRAVEKALERLGGPRARALGYDYFVGEYFFVNLNPAGAIEVATPEAERYLAGSWSAPMNRNGPSRFRWAVYPMSCVRFPLDWPPEDLAGAVTARAHEHLGTVGLAVSLNATRLGSFDLSAQWSEVRFGLPATAMIPGENVLCLEFSSGLPGEGTERLSAAIASIQIGS